MKVKLMKPNKNNKIELTEKELNDLLEEAYNEGYKACIDPYLYPYNPYNSPDVPYTKIWYNTNPNSSAVDNICKKL